MSAIPSCNHNCEQFKQYGALDHHLKVKRESVIVVQDLRRSSFIWVWTMILMVVQYFFI